MGWLHWTAARRCRQEEVNLKWRIRACPRLLSGRSRVPVPALFFPKMAYPVAGVATSGRLRLGNGDWVSWRVPSGRSLPSYWLLAARAGCSISRRVSVGTFGS